MEHVLFAEVMEVFAWRTRKRMTFLIYKLKALKVNYIYIWQFLFSGDI